MAEKKKRWVGDFRAYEGKKIGWSKRDNKMESDASWNKRKNTGWKYEGGKWVQYRPPRNNFKTHAITR